MPVFLLHNFVSFFSACIHFKTAISFREQRKSVFPVIIAETDNSAVLIFCFIIAIAPFAVLPVIFAQAIASLPATIGGLLGAGEDSWVNTWFGNTSILYAIIYFLLIIFFAYFYSTIQFNPVEVANNLKKNGGFIPGFRPGKPTADFIRKVLNKVTLFGAIYLGIVCVLPIALVVLLSLISPDFRQGLHTVPGIVCLVVGGAMDALALLIIRRILKGVQTDD